MRNKGITLIALVITIVVLLILAGVSISLVVGDNGVLSKATKSKIETEIAKEKESIGIAYSGLKSDVIAGNESKIDVVELEEEIEKLYNNGEVTVSEGAIIIKVKFEATQREYILDKDGNILEKLPIEEILATASKHPEQTLTEDIGVAEDGTAVNLDLWKYELDIDNTYCLGGIYSSGYAAENIIDGKIQGKVPMYIKEQDGEFYEVSYISFYKNKNLIISPELPSSLVTMNYSFWYCDNLTTVTNIPNGVLTMHYTFFSCDNLQEVPDIPDSVIGMGYAFNGCGLLKKSPKLSSNVKFLSYTFSECYSLEYVPEIPDSVENLTAAFSSCTNLTGTLKINAIPTEYNNCFYNTSTAEGTSLVLVGNGENDEVITNLYNTKSENSNITIGN